MMTADEQAFLRDFFRALEDRPLDPDDPAYIGLYHDPALGLEDPVELLFRSIEWAPTNTSAQLLSGFRGAGKSTELRRLRRDLTQAGYLVVLFDVGDYLSPSSPIDVSDFVMVLAGALSDGLDDAEALPHAAARETYWTRLRHFLQTRVELEEVVGKLGAVDIKASLRTDPTFRRLLQQRAAGHLAELVKDMREYVAETLAAIPPDRLGSGLVLIADSIENISGTITNSEDVQTSLERLFTSHAENLHVPGVHLVYTVPPWLKIRAPGISARFSGGLQVLHPLKVRTPDAERRPVQSALDALCQVVSARGDWRRLLGERAVLDRLALESGGHLRDLMRLLSEIVRRADRLPVTELTVQRAITQVKTELLPIAIDDARWLQRIAETQDAALEEIGLLPRLATLLDSHVLLSYRSGGEDWYEVHPLVRDEVARLAADTSVERVERENVRVEQILERGFLRNLREPVRVAQLRLDGTEFFDGNTRWLLNDSVTVLLGRNGYGKSLLLRTLVGMLQRDPETTAVLFEGAEPSARITLELLRDDHEETLERDREVFLDKPVGKVPVLAIPDSRFMDRGATIIATPAAMDLASNGAEHFLRQRPYQAAVDGLLGGLALDYFENGQTFDLPAFRLIAEVVRKLSGRALAFERIERQSRIGFRIWVRTEGVNRPLIVQQASQGTLSVLTIFGLVHSFLKDVAAAAGVDHDTDAVGSQEGIVVIDEVDAHLHPAWQQRIRGLLVDTFPNVQFILSAHSPLVVAGCGPGEVSVLRAGGAEGFRIEQMDEDFVGASTYELYRKIFDIEDLDDAFLECAMREARETPGDRERADHQIDVLLERTATGPVTRSEDRDLQRLLRDRARLERVAEVREQRRIERDKVRHLETRIAGLQHQLAVAERQLEQQNT